MKRTIKQVATGATVLVATGAMLVGGAGVAFAATPPFEPDTTNQLGQLMFYNAAGQEVTSGSVNDTPFAVYAVGSTDDPITTNTKATLYGYLPVNGVAPGAWSGEALSASTTFPVVSGPSLITGAGAHRPVVTQTSADTTLATLQTDFPHPAGDSGTAYDGLYQLRLKTAGNTKWWAADVQITGTNWSLVYPTVAATTTTVSESPTSPQTVVNGAAPSSITITANTSAGVPGTVQFFKNGAAFGSPVTVSGGTASTTDTPAGPAAGGSPVTTTYKAVFTPSAGVADAPSTSADSQYVVQNKLGDATTTSLAVSQTGFTGDPVTFNSDVKDTPTPASIPAGSVSWYDNGSSTALATATLDGSGHATATLAAGFATAGAHSVVAKFTPTDSAAFAPSQSSAVTFNQIDKSSPCADPASQCTDTQVFKTTVNAGTLVISTPYTGVDAAHTFDLGTMVLDPTGTYLHTSAAFGTTANPAAGVTITDQRAGDLPWTANVQTSDFTSGANVINGQNLGFISVAPSYISGNALNATTKPVVTNNVPNGGPGTVYAATAAGSNGLKGTAHQFATAAHGDGSVYVIGTMDLYAPTSTVAGTYTATVTFTIG